MNEIINRICTQLERLGIRTEKLRIRAKDASGLVINCHDDCTEIAIGVEDAKWLLEKLNLANLDPEVLDLLVDLDNLEPLDLEDLDDFPLDLEDF